MGVPASLSIDEVAAHGFVARQKIFDHAGQYVSIVWGSIGRGWTFEKYIGLGTLSGGQALFEDASFLPKFENTGLKPGKVLRLFHGLKHDQSALRSRLLCAGQGKESTAVHGQSQPLLWHE